MASDPAPGNQPADDPPTSDPPTSDPPTSNPPTSNPPTSNPPTSNPPTSNPPAAIVGEAGNRIAYTLVNIPGARNSIFSRLNFRDWQSLRRTNSATRSAAVATDEERRRQLGAGCDDTVGTYPGPASNLTPRRCTTGSQSVATTRYCEINVNNRWRPLPAFNTWQQNPHPLFHQVCSRPCREEHSDMTAWYVRQKPLLTLCKECTLRQRRLYPRGIDNCTCQTDIMAEWNCFECVQTHIHELQRVASNDLQDLYYTVKRKGRVVPLPPSQRVPRRRRLRPACPGAGNRRNPHGACGNQPWVFALRDQNWPRWGRAAKLCPWCKEVKVPDPTDAPTRYRLWNYGV